MQREHHITADLQSDAEFQQLIADTLGYLNFSRGTPDPRFQCNLNALFAKLGPAVRVAGVRDVLLQRLAELQSEQAAFADSHQARNVIELTIDGLLPKYRAHHRDLLYYLDEIEFERPLLLAKFLEAVLEQGAPWTERDRILDGALLHVNDFIGYRPLAVLENEQRMQPYAHERFRPVPLYIREVGAVAGPYQQLIERTIAFIAEMPDAMLTDAYFDLSRLDELALDVRSHDHMHPVNKRTNYMFGEWDPHIIDTRGFYRRFVIRKIILDGMLMWMNDNDSMPAEELLYDASAVLCGTMLMASSISGCGPETYDSTISLTSLLPRVARQRDRFYTHLLEVATGPRLKRLRKAEQATHQPFGHVRQTLNMHLARYGAQQVQHRHVAYLYARMGYEDASRAEAAAIPSSAIRFECDIQCRITASHRHLDDGNLSAAATALQEADDLLQRGIECGAIVDPWNILGFQGHFPLFSAREDAVPDNRVETLLEMMERLFGAFARGVEECAAQGDRAVQEELIHRFRRLTEQWDKYATSTVEDLPRVRGLETFEAAEHVAAALAEWRNAHAAAGDISFWREHVSRFRSARAYAMCVGTLLRKRDHIASMGLLMQWLAEADDVGLESGPHSIHPLLLDWMRMVTTDDETRPTTEDPWPVLRRLFDYLEANAGEYWQIPELRFFVAGLNSTGEENLPPLPMNPEDDPFDEADDEDNLFDAAWDGVVFRDSADDGHVGDTVDEGYNPGNTEFEVLNRQIEPRLKFLFTLSQLWQLAAARLAAQPGNEAERATVIRNWLEHVGEIRRGLARLITEINEYEISTSAGDLDSNIEYDIQLQTRMFLLHTAIATSVSTLQAEWILHCCLPARLEKTATRTTGQLVVDVYRGLFNRDPEAVRTLLPDLMEDLANRPLLYMPLESGGNPEKILKARALQALMRFLLSELPRIGLLRETRQLLQTAYDMERSSRTGGLAVTEFDRLFRAALGESLEFVIVSSDHWKSGNFDDRDLLKFVHSVVDSYQRSWTLHSGTMRLSCVEELNDESLADDVCEFIETYGADLFHARLLTLGNIRTILHHGVEAFLEYLDENADPLQPVKLLDDLEHGRIDDAEAAEHLKLIYECIVDKFDRYLEYNTTTTQSDYGEKCYSLLEFLVVEVAYDRENWKLIPARIAHETLIRLERHTAGRLWEEEIRRKTADMADDFVEQLEDLETAYGMRLPSVRDHINERFVKSLAVNRMASLVPRAVADTREKTGDHSAFDTLCGEINSYREDTVGSGIDVPSWLRTLERELNQIDTEMHLPHIPDEIDFKLPPVRMNLTEMRRALRDLDKPLRDTPTKQRRRGKS